MFGWVYDFYKRHRRKIFITGLTAGGIYAVSKYISWKVSEWEDAKARENSSQAKKQFLYESNQRTCTITFLSFLPNVRDIIVNKLNTEELLEVLKLKPINKLEIWEQLKVLSNARIISSVLVNTALFVFLKVQLNIVGGYMFARSQKQIAGTVDEELNNIQVTYLNNVRYLIEVKLEALIDDVVVQVKDMVAEIPLTEKISHCKLNELLNTVIDRLGARTSDVDNDQHFLCAYMVDPQWKESLKDSELYKKMTLETVDILESADCTRVLDACLHAGLKQVLRNIKDSFYGYEEDPEAIVSAADTVNKAFFKDIDLPLAKILPLLNTQLHEIFKANNNDFLDELFSQNLIREFSTNIYDAFSKDYC